MADKKISELTALTSPDGAEELVVNDGGTSKKITIDDLFAGDNVKANFGAGNDLQIYHDGSNSYIDDTATGDLIIRGSAIYLQKYTGETLINAVADGAAKLYYDAAERLATTSTGIDVTGTVTADGLTVETGSGNTYPIASTSADNLVISDKTASTPVGITIFSDNASQGNIFFGDENDADNGRIVYDHNGNANTMSFYANGAERLSVDSTGIDVTGTVTADGLTVDGSAEISSIRPILDMMCEGASNENLRIDVNVGTLRFRQLNDAKDSATERFHLDTNTGDISFYEDTGTTAKLFWDASAESLGIGTSSPSTALDVTGTVTADGLTVDGDTTNLSYSKTYFTNGVGTNKWHMWNESVSGADKFQLVDGAGQLVFQAEQTGDISFYEDTGTTAKFFWDASAESLGIGTSSPSNLLELDAGSGTNAGMTIRMGTGNSGANDSFIGFENSAGTEIIRTRYDNPLTSYIVSSDTSGDILTVTRSGNVGIGTSSPAYQLTVQPSSGNAQIGIRTNDTTSVAQLIFGRSDDSNRGGIYYDMTEEAMEFHAGNTGEKMRIDSSGNLLVGTTSTGATQAENGSYSTSSGQYVTRSDEGTVVYINKRTNNGNAIAFFRDTTLVGTISVTGSSTAYNTSSDYRLKTDVQPMTDATERLKALKPVNFEWIADGTRVDGFLAHEAQEIVPEAVTGTKDAMRTEEYEVTPAVLDDDGNVVTEAVMGEREVPDYQGIDQSKLVPLLVATIQELEARITQLENS